MTRISSPRLLSRLQDYFTRNPDDWLSLEDVMTKFKCGKASARKAIGKCTADGKARRISVYAAVVPASEVSSEVSK